ncbi:MAG: hypothetical protein ABR991_09340 [Terracidiphilus sp.]
MRGFAQKAAFARAGQCSSVIFRGVRHPKDMKKYLLGLALVFCLAIPYAAQAQGDGDHHHYHHHHHHHHHPHLNP